MSSASSNNDSLTQSDWSLQLHDNEHESASTRSSVCSVRSTVAAAGLMPLNNAQSEPMVVDEEFWNGDSLDGTIMTMNATSSNTTGSGLAMSALGSSSMAQPSAVVLATHNPRPLEHMNPGHLATTFPPQNDITSGSQRPSNSVMPASEPMDQIPDFDSFAMGGDLYTQRAQGGLSDLSLFDFDRPWWLSPGSEQATVQAEPASLNDAQPGPRQPTEPPKAAASTGADAQPRARSNPVSEEHWPRLERFWSRSATKSTRLMSTLWEGLLGGHGLFCGESEQGQATNADELTSVWSLDVRTRQTVHTAFCALLDPAERDSGQFTVPGPDMFDLAFEQYVFQHHKVMPMIHLPTFRAAHAPTSLLVVACTMGLSIIGNADLIRLVCKVSPVSWFIRVMRYRGSLTDEKQKVLDMAFDELHSSTTGSCSLETRMSALLTAALSLCLSSLMSVSCLPPDYAMNTRLPTDWYRIVSGAYRT